MKKKFALQLKDLKVKSFVTKENAGDKVKGGATAYHGSTCYSICAGVTCYESCNGTCEYSCGQLTCNGGPC